MNQTTWFLAAGAMLGIAVTDATAVRADDDHFGEQRNAYVINKLVSDFQTKAKFQDPVLQNAWGVAFSPAGSPFWIADNATGCSTLYISAGRTWSAVVGGRSQATLGCRCSPRRARTVA